MILAYDANYGERMSMAKRANRRATHRLTRYSASLVREPAGRLQEKGGRPSTSGYRVLALVIGAVDRSEIFFSPPRKPHLLRDRDT